MFGDWAAEQVRAQGMATGQGGISVTPRGDVCAHACLSHPWLAAFACFPSLRCAADITAHHLPVFGEMAE